MNDLSSESTCTCLCSIKAPDGIFCLFEKLYFVFLRLSVVCQVLYVFSTLCEVMVQLLLQIFVQACCHGRFESGPGLTRVKPGFDAGLTHCKPGFDAGLTHCKPGLDLGLACALTILRYDANMNQKGSLLFCAFNGCPQELDFKTGGCHSKGKFYGALKHNCGTPNGEVSCGYVSKDLAIEHKFRIVDKDSLEGKKLQKETGWSRTDFVWVPEDTMIRPIRSDVGTKRGREHVSGINTDQETEQMSKKQVLPCLASFCQSQLACHASRLSCKQSLRNTGDCQGYAHRE